MKHLLKGVAIAAILAGTPALAANDKNTQNQMRAPSSIEFMNSQSNADWLSSNLIGASVKNRQNETLGDINNIVLTESGDIKAVIIGVGGFLGIGEKDVAVMFSALEIKSDSGARMSKDVERLPAGRTPAEQARQRDEKMELSSPQQSNKTMTEPGKTDQDPTVNRDRTVKEPRTAAERAEVRHDNVVIILDATKKQLESAPEFKYLGEREKRADISRKLYSEDRRR